MPHAPRIEVSTSRRRRARHTGVLALCLMAVLAASALVMAQRGFRGFNRPRYDANVPYDGQFTFARIRYSEFYGSGWAFDYPTMERNLMRMMSEITALSPHVRAATSTRWTTRIC